MSADDCLGMMEKEDWFVKAACRDMDPNVFFPNNLATIEEDRAIAKRVCSNCEVKQLCKERARDRREEYGVWGGEDEDERWLALGGPDSDMVQRSTQRGFWEND
jgi:WhiB family redox-sensing transcriptional regulator